MHGVRAAKTPFAQIFLRRRLVLRIVRSDLRVRYAGAVLGTWWLLLYPIFMLAAYASVYLFVFRVRPTGMTTEAYVLYLFSGLVPFLASAEAITLSANSVTASRALFANTVFPVELAPVKAVFATQPAQAVALLLCLLGTCLLGSVTPNLLLLPLVWVLHIAFLIGLAWLLALVTLVFRDLQAMLPIVVMLLYIVSPIAYTPDMVPARLQPLLWLNPLAPFILCYQQILALGVAPSAGQLLLCALLAAAFFFGGSSVFARAKSIAVDYA